MACPENNERNQTEGQAYPVSLYLQRQHHRTELSGQTEVRVECFEEEKKKHPSKSQVASVPNSLQLKTDRKRRPLVCTPAKAHPGPLRHLSRYTNI